MSGFVKFLKLLTAIFYKKRPGKKQSTNPLSSKPKPPVKKVEIEKKSSKFLWMLDNGHGKKTKGKKSPELPNGKRFFEWKYNRIIVNRIAKELDKLGIAYHIVVPETDCGNMLRERTRRANSFESDKPKIFVSVHFNAGSSYKGTGWSKGNGIETWFKYGHKISMEFAAIFQKHLLAKTGLRDRGIKTKQKKQFYVLRATGMPAILTENGFFNNQVEVKKLMKLEMIEAIVKAHVSAIVEIENSSFTKQDLEEVIKLAISSADGDRSRDRLNKKN